MNFFDLFRKKRNDAAPTSESVIPALTVPDAHTSDAGLPGHESSSVGTATSTDSGAGFFGGDGGASGGDGGGS